MQANDRARAYWRRNMRLIAVLLGIWFVAAFVVPYAARALASPFFGWPFSFWMAAQGAPLIFVILVGYYARTINRRDREATRGADGGT